jgi:hypothetical protein
VQDVNQHQRALALAQVALELLAVTGVVAGQVQEVVLDLERRPEEEAEAHELVEVHAVAGADQRANPARVDGRVPAGLLQRHREVVGFADGEAVLAPPAQLERLSLHRFAHHALGLLHHAPREPKAERRHVAEQRPQPQNHERVPGVQRRRDAVQPMQRGQAAPLFTFVLDVVVHQEGAVQKLERYGRAHGFLDRSAERTGRSDAEARAQAATFSQRVVRGKLVHFGTAAFLVEKARERLLGERPVLVEHVAHEVGGVTHRRPRQATTRLSVPRGF